MYTYNYSNENYLIINVLFTNNIPNQNQIKLTNFDNWNDKKIIITKWLLEFSKDVK